MSAHRIAAGSGRGRIEDQHFDGLTVLSIAPLISAAIHEVFEDGSVTSLFGGRA